VAALPNLFCQLCPVEFPVCFLNFAKLLPRALHQALLIVLDDLRSVAGRDAVPRVDVQRVEPVWKVKVLVVETRVLESRDASVILPVQRRSDRAVVGLLDDPVRFVQQVPQFCLECFVVAVGVGVDCSQRAADADGAGVRVRARRWFQRLRAGVAGVDRPESDVVAEGPLFEFPGEILEVAFFCAGELPVVIDRQSHVAVGPRKADCVASLGVGVESKSGTPARFERRDDTRAVGGLWVEIPRTDQPCDSRTRAGLKRLFGVGVADELGVGPRPRLDGVGELVGRRFEDGERAGPGRPECRLLAWHDDETEPRASPPLTVCLLRAELPRQARIVELDVGKVVRRKLARPRLWLHPHNLVGVDCRHLARSVDRDVCRHLRRLRSVRTLAGDGQRHLGLPAAVDAVRVSCKRCVWPISLPNGGEQSVVTH